MSVSIFSDYLVISYLYFVGPAVQIPKKSN